VLLKKGQDKGTYPAANQQHVPLGAGHIFFRPYGIAFYMPTPYRYVALGYTGS